RGIYVGDVKGSPSVYLFDADAAAIYVSGQLLFVRQGVLYAQPFDPDRLTLGGEPAAIAGDNIPAGGGGANIAAIAASASGTILYRNGSARRRQFKWVDRDGRVLSTVGDVDPFNMFNPSLSGDGRVAYNETRDNNTDLWIVDGSGQRKRLTKDP